MKLGMIGLGRMGMNMARRLIQGGHEVVVWNRTQEKVKQMEGEGAIGAATIEDLAAKLDAPRIVWIMLPAGKLVDEQIKKLKGLLEKGDIIIEGGNSYYEDDIRRYSDLKTAGINYIDAGVSGGVWGLKIGYCTMIGGDKPVFDYIGPIIKTLAPDEGYLYCGGPGAGHFVKMVHNGIEYAMMEAYGEGFEMLKASPYGDNLDFSKVSHLWNQGSVIRSWLLELLKDAFHSDPGLDKIEGYVDDSGEARWTVKKAVDLGVALPVISLSLFKRFQSRDKNLFADRVLAALRNEFGGHTVKEAKK